MGGDRTLPQGRLRGLFFWALAAAVPQAHALDCRPPALAAIGGQDMSRWEEFDARERSLVRERGQLTRLGLAGHIDCGALEGAAQLSRSRGQRAYAGETNFGSPFQTTSQLETRELRLHGLGALTERWALGARLGYREIDRTIEGRGNVLGYPERFAYWQGALGARFQTPLTDGVRLSLSHWVGGGPRGTVRVDLPNADPLTLPLGSSRVREWNLQLSGGNPSASGWSWQAALDWRREEMGAGEARAVWRNGIPIGGANQPRTQQRLRSLTAAGVYRF